MREKTVAVIGAGIGGMSAAIHLAHSGFKVTVVEMRETPGGRCDQIQREGHTFDTGPTLMVMPLVYEAEFRAMGTPLGEALELQRVDPTYRLAFDDGSGLSLSSDLKRMEQQLEALEPGSFGAFLRYLEEGDRHYHLAMKHLVDREFRRAGEFFTPRMIPLLFQVRPLVKHYDNVSRYFREPRLRSAFSFQDVYMGLSPFEAPATFSMMPYTELAHGVFYPRGGMYSIAEAMERMAREAGVEFVYDTTVERIEVEGGRARGLRLEHGERMAADAVLANADLPYVYEKLLPPEKYSEQLQRKKYSCSVVSFFWGVDKAYPQLGAHTLFLADDYRANFKSIIEDMDIPENPSVYIHAPCRLDASMAPEGQDTIIGIVPVGHMRGDGEGQDWAGMRDCAREHVFRRLKTLGITDLQEHIKMETCYLPPTWEKHYNLVRGSTHGLSHNLTQLAYLRPHNRHARYGNVYFVGASTHPGTGMPTAMISGRLAARRIGEEVVDG
jgi:phytoene desaturase